jgi:hypothetical protein
MKAGSRQQPGEATARRHPLTGIVPVSEITALRGHIMSGFGTAPAAASATRLPTISAGLRAGWLRDDVSDCDRRGVASELALTNRSADPAPGREFPGSQPSGTAAARKLCRSWRWDHCCRSASADVAAVYSQPHVDVARVALEYGHT